MHPNQDLFYKTEFFIKIPISWILNNFPGLQGSAGSGWSSAAKEKAKELTIVLEILRIHFAVDFIQREYLEVYFNWNENPTVAQSVHCVHCRVYQHQHYSMDM